MKLRWREWILAFVIAVTFWYGISGTERVETQVELAVDYRGTPPGMVIRGDGLVNKVTVRVSGPVGLIRSISGRTFPFSMDLSSLQKGENALPVRHGQVRLPLGLEVIEVSPPVIHLMVDSLETKKLPVEAEVTGELPEDLVVMTTVEPHEVEVRGASEVVDTLSSLRVTVPVDKNTMPGSTETLRTLSLPLGVDAVPPNVRVGMTVNVKRKEVQVSRKVHVSVPASRGVFIRPDKVTITVAMPESLASRAASNKDIQATGQLTQVRPGIYSLPVEVSLPEGAELIKVDPPKVSVTLEQK